MSSPSYWFEEVSDYKRFPSLEGNLRVDATVIGGGIAGISAAYFLAQRGIRVALLEKRNLATGASGYTTAFASHFLDSTDTTLRTWQASEMGIQLFREIIKKEHIVCDWKNVDGVGFTKKDDLSKFRRDFEAYRSVDPLIEYFKDKDAFHLAGFPVRAAYRKKGGEGQFHIRKFLLGLAKCASKNGALIFEGTNVNNIDSEGSLITISTENGLINTDWLIVASGPPPRQFFPKVADKLRSAITYVIQASYKEKKPFGPSLFWDDLEPYHYFRWLNDTDLILGGEDWVMEDKFPETNPHQALETWLREISRGSPFSMVNTWQGNIFYTPDILPFIGPHREYGEQIIFLTGFGGNGMAHGLLAGQMAADFTERRKNPLEDIFSLKNR